MAEIISIANIKGGVGKSTIAINLAGYLSKTSNVYLVDADPQGTICDWHRVRKQKNPENNKNLSITDEPYSFESLETKLFKEIKLFDFIIIDCPPEDDKIMRAVLVFSNYTIIPVTPSPFDIRSANKTAKIIKEGLNSKAIKVKPRFVISRKIVGTVLGRETKDAIKVFKIPVLKAEINQRISLCEAGIHGQTIFEYAPMNKATREFEKLGKEVLGWVKRD